MPRPSSPKPASYKQLGDNIIRTGAANMAPCTQCQKSGVDCIVKKGYKRCGPCTKKNVRCSGNFSQTVFENLEKKKQELRKASLDGRRLMRVFAKQLLAQEKRQEEIERRLEEITHRQDKMLEREARILGELEELAPDPTEPDQEVMGWEDDFFRFDDPSRLDYGLVPELDLSVFEPLVPGVGDPDGGTDQPVRG